MNAMEKQVKQLKDLGIFKFIVKNSRIDNVVIELEGGLLVANVEFIHDYGGCVWKFFLTNHTDLQRLTKLLSFAGVTRFNDLKERIVRVAFCNDFICGIGDPVKDKFIQTSGEEIGEVSEKQLEELQKKN